MRPEIGTKLFLEVEVREIYEIAGETEVWFSYVGPMGYKQLSSAPLAQFKQPLGKIHRCGMNRSPTTNCDGWIDTRTGESGGGCQEPCSFVMQKLGYGIPPWTEKNRDFEK